MEDFLYLVKVNDVSSFSDPRRLTPVHECWHVVPARHQGSMRDIVHIVLLLGKISRRTDGAHHPFIFIPSTLLVVSPGGFRSFLYF